MFVETSVEACSTGLSSGPSSDQWRGGHIGCSRLEQILWFDCEKGGGLDFQRLSFEIGFWPLRLALDCMGWNNGFGFEAWLTVWQGRMWGLEVWERIHHGQLNWWLIRGPCHWSVTHWYDDMSLTCHCCYWSVARRHCHKDWNDLSRRYQMMLYKWMIWTWKQGLNIIDLSKYNIFDSIWALK